MTIEERIWQANIDVHQAEALAYDQIHLEIFNGIEQQRLVRNLKYAKELVRSRSDIAFDFGCGTGNVTSKLLMMGWKVVAGDVSENMLKALSRKFCSENASGKLITQLITRKEIELPGASFGLITMYSVLHHIYDYMHTIDQMTQLLDSGGVLYIGHENSDDFWALLKSPLYRLYLLSSRILNYGLLRVFRRVYPPKIDHALSDYRTKQSTKVDWRQVSKFLVDRGFNVYVHKYLSCRSWLPNPLFLVLRLSPSCTDMISLFGVKP